MICSWMHRVRIWGEVRKAAEELKALMTSGLEREAVKDIFGSINLELAQENLIRSPQLIARVREELAKYDALSAKSKELEALVHQHLDEDKWLDQFIEALYTDTITKKARSMSMTVTRTRMPGSRSPI